MKVVYNPRTDFRETNFLHFEAANKYFNFNIKCTYADFKTKRDFTQTTTKINSNNSPSIKQEAGITDSQSIKSETTSSKNLTYN